MGENWEKEKLLITSFFKRFVLETSKKQDLFGKALNADQSQY